MTTPDRLRYRRLANAVRGRDPEGAPSEPKVELVKFIVTDVDPILMGKPLTGGPPLSLEWTDAVQGVKASEQVWVDIQGVCLRRAVALVAPKPLAEKAAGETLGNLNGKPITVGGTVTLTASDVDALPEGTRAQDIGAQPAGNYASASHRHSLPGVYVEFDDPLPPSGLSSEMSTWAYQVRSALNALRNFAYNSRSTGEAQ